MRHWLVVVLVISMTVPAFAFEPPSGDSAPEMPQMNPNEPADKSPDQLTEEELKEINKDAPGDEMPSFAGFDKPAGETAPEPQPAPEPAPAPTPEAGKVAVIVTETRLPDGTVIKKTTYPDGTVIDETTFADGTKRKETWFPDLRSVDEWWYADGGHKITRKTQTDENVFTDEEQWYAAGPWTYRHTFMKNDDKTWERLVWREGKVETSSYEDGVLIKKFIINPDGTREVYDFSTGTITITHPDGRVQVLDMNTGEPLPIS